MGEGGRGGVNEINYPSRNCSRNKLGHANRLLLSFFFFFHQKVFKHFKKIPAGAGPRNVAV